jgi:hypothetical protein
MVINRQRNQVEVMGVVGSLSQAIVANTNVREWEYSRTIDRAMREGEKGSVNMTASDDKPGIGTVVVTKKNFTQHQSNDSHSRGR